MLMVKYLINDLEKGDRSIEIIKHKEDTKSISNSPHFFPNYFSHLQQTSQQALGLQQQSSIQSQLSQLSGLFGRTI